MAQEPTPVQAAGVVLLRPTPHGLDVALIHRPLRQDWSLPKGKVDPGEHVIAAAVRECDEETGLVPILGVPLPRQEYVALGRPKAVDYWVARIGRDEGFTPDDEVDEVRWMGVDEAIGHLTYPRDGDLVRLAAEIPETSPLILLRHARAMKRSDYRGTDDADRPLTGRGRTEAKELVPLIGAFGVETVHSSPAERCRETVRKYAKSIDAPVHAEPWLSEAGHASKPAKTAKRMRELLRDPQPILVCSHRPVLPTLIEAIVELRLLGTIDLDHRLPPGGFLVVHRSFDDDGEPTIVGIERHRVDA